MAHPYRWMMHLHCERMRLGIKPNASEYFIIRNVHQGSQYADQATVHIDYIEVTAPYVAEWPPASHRRVFPEQAQSGDEEIDAQGSRQLHAEGLAASGD